MGISTLIFIMGIVELICGFDVTADTTFEDMSSDGDPEGNIDASFILLTVIMTVIIFFIAICGCCVGHLRDKICIGAFAIVGTIIMIFMFVIGAAFLTLNAAGDELCEVVNDPSKMEEVSGI